ncbi:MAG: hypothetical protein QXR73_02150, partial [Candidatus Micrarchaeaceae archaeon]
MTLVFIIILAGMMLYAQHAHAYSPHGTSTQPSSQSSEIAGQISRVKNITYEYIYSANGKKLEGLAE